MHAEVWNAALTLSFSRMALGVTPTRFQWGVIPPFARAKTVVQFDGIDTDYFTADANAVLQLPSGVVLRAGDEVVTFANRVFEPARGIHRFVEALPRVLAARPNAHVVLIGLDRPQVRYGAGRRGRGWLTALKANHTDVDWSRVHEVGKVARKGMRQIFRISAVHVLLAALLPRGPFGGDGDRVPRRRLGHGAGAGGRPRRPQRLPRAVCRRRRHRGAHRRRARDESISTHTRMRRAARALVVERYAASQLWRARAALVEGVAGATNGWARQLWRPRRRAASSHDPTSPRPPPPRCRRRPTARPAAGRPPRRRRTTSRQRVPVEGVQRELPGRAAAARGRRRRGCARIDRRSRGAHLIHIHTSLLVAPSENAQP